jgi:putative ABC transport system permease protein
MFQHVRQSLRLLYRRPGGSIAIVLTTALGIGLTSAVFGIVDAVLLRPLPYRDPSALVTTRGVSHDLIESWRSRTQVLSDIAYYNFNFAPLVLNADESVQLRQGAVSSNLLDTLGVMPMLGRGFTRDDARTGAEPVAILTYGAWQDHFGGRSTVIGEVAPTEPVPVRIVAVLPPDFLFPMRALPAIGATRILTVLTAPRRDESPTAVVARRVRAATLEQVRAEESALLNQSPTNPTRHPQAADLTTMMVGSHRSSLFMLLGAVGLLLLIACANVTHLFLARCLDGRRDLTIRLAVGASRSDIVRLLLTQSCALSLAGGLLGLVVAYLSVDALIALAPAPLPRAGDASIDGRVVAFGSALSLVSGVVVGVLTAWSLSKADTQESLRQDDRTAAVSQRLRHVLTTMEVAFAVVLLAGAGLALNSFVRLLRVDTGFDSERVLTLRARGVESRYPTPERQRQLLDRMLERLAMLQGVERAGAVDLLPVTRATAGGSVIPIDRPGAAAPIDAEPRTVAGDYFPAMRIDLIRGRAFDRRDVAASPQVAIVNEALARQLGEADAVGRRVRHRNVAREIVGIVRDVRMLAVDTAPAAQIYVPHAQTASVPPQIVIRTTARPEAMAAPIRAEIHAIEPRVVLENMRPLSQHVASSIAQPRFQTWLLGIFGTSGLLLVAVGVSGIVSSTVSRRTRELGIRVALGARALHVIRTVAGTSLAAVAAGLAIGLLGALSLSRIAKAFLYEVEPTDPWTLAGVVVVLAIVALVAAALPARRALGIDPIVALRSE